MKRRTVLFCTMLFIVCHANCQFWFVKNGDTIKSPSVTYNEYYKVDPYLEWVDKNWETQKIDFPKDKGITAFRESDENNTYSLMNVPNAKENNKYCKIIILSEVSVYQYNIINMDQFYLVKIGKDGELKKIQYNGDVEKYVQPKLFECEYVRKVYDGKNIGIVHLLEAIKIYNYFNSKISMRDYMILTDKSKKEFVSVEEGRLNGNVISLRTVDKEGNFEQIKGKEECENIKSYCIDGRIYDLIPLNPNKPEGYQRHMWRKIDGKIKFYDFYNVITKYDPSKISNQSSTTFIIKTVKLDNGSYYDVKKGKTIEEDILPYFKKCKNFTSKYIEKERKTSFTPIQEDYNNRLTENMIKLYNTVCN